MNRRLFFQVSALLFAACAAPACGPSEPRSLVVADGSGTVHAIAVDRRVEVFRGQTGRQVKIMQVPPSQAVLLASRGEADVAVVPMDTAIDSFLAPEHGTVKGFLDSDGERLRVLLVNAKQHPKVDAKGAEDLASALTLPEAK